MKNFTLIRSTNDLPKPGKTVYLVYIRFIDYKNDKPVVLRKDENVELSYTFGFARYLGKGMWQRLGGELTGYIENLRTESEIPSADHSAVAYTYPDENEETEIEVRCDVIAYYELPKTPSEEVMRSIPQPI